jgi:DNA-binding MarR family transcriptional regulator
MTAPRWLTAEEDRAWRGYRRMRSLLDLQITRDLARDSDLSDADYDVLSNLSEAQGRRARLNELADRMFWSKSRLSHHLTRMQQRGLVAREECVDDARGAVIVLTPAGLRTIKAAAPHHVESVRRSFIDLLSDEQIAVLADIAERVVGRLEGIA